MAMPHDRDHDAGGESTRATVQQEAVRTMSLLDDDALEAAAISDGGGTMKRLIAADADQDLDREQEDDERVATPSAGAAQGSRARSRGRGGDGHDAPSSSSAAFPRRCMPRLASSRRSLQICAT